MIKNLDLNTFQEPFQLMGKYQDQGSGLLINAGIYFYGFAWIVLLDEIEDRIAILQGPRRPLQFHTTPPSDSLRRAMAWRLAEWVCTTSAAIAGRGSSSASWTLARNQAP